MSSKADDLRRQAALAKRHITLVADERMEQALKKATQEYLEEAERLEKEEKKPHS